MADAQQPTSSSSVNSSSSTAHSENCPTPSSDMTATTAMPNKTTTSPASGTDAFAKDPEKAATFIPVTWQEGDPEYPPNWSKAFRWFYTIVVAFLVVSAAFGSSVITGDMMGAVDSFNVSMEVSTLQVSLMVCGFAVGPLLWSPLSEMYGRKPVYIVALGIYVVFNIPCALAQNIGTLLVCRFLCGFFASVALTLAGGTIGDLFDNAAERGGAIAYFAAAPYAGPVLGPIAGGWIGIGTHTWRWIYWVNMIFAGVMWIFMVFLPETYGPALLARRAKNLRKKTGDPRYRILDEPFESRTELIKSTLIRPFTMLATEPILLLMSLYVAIIYALLYAFFFAYPIVFGEVHGFNDGFIGLTFIGVLIGVAFALCFTPRLEKWYAASAQEPEDRLPGMMIAAPFVPISLFIFGWTSYPHVHWIGPCFAGLPFGFGMVTIYYSANNYIIDCFSKYIASALSAKTVVRSGGGAAFPLFIVQMYHGLGNQWASTLLAFISLAIVPIPFAFYKWGAQIRARSATSSKL